MTIHYLCDVPQHTETLAGWIFETFPHEFETMTFEAWLEVVKHPERVTYVAVEKGQALGTATLDFEDLPPRNDLTPWLASVYVLPQYRAKGLGTLLVSTVEREARAKGFKQIYLHTLDRVDYYAKRGWTVIETVDYWQQLNTVMVKHLT